MPPTPPRRACQMRRCGRVDDDALLCAVSTLTSSDELVLCAHCRRELALDAFVVVEILEERAAA